MGHEAKNVYVKLGLVKPKKQPTARETLQYRLTEKEIEHEYKYDKFLEQVIDGKEKNFAIVGEPGAGKSTWLEQIALYVNKSEKGFPICISLASLGGKTLEDYLLQIWLEDALPFISTNALEVTPALKKNLKELFNNGKAWLLLDGVDEMGGQSNSAPLQTITNQLRGWVDQARVVLTCRLNVWEANPNALPNFETYHTLHFDDEQVGNFIGQWFTQEGKPELGEKLQNNLGESGNERTLDLIKNPLRLAMLCGIWYLNQGDLPKTKAALYQRYIYYFYQWKPRPLLTEDLDKQEELHTAFSKLALEAIDKKLPLRKKFVHKVMGQSLFQLARDVGWLNWVYKDAETGEDVYAFFHFTFQEYFAAYGIEDWDYFLPREHKNKPVEDKDNPGKYKPYRIFEPQWKEVFLLWLGLQEEELMEQKSTFIEALVEFKDGCNKFYSYRAYFLAAAGIAEFKNPKSDEIVALIVTLSFGYLNSNKEWVTFSNPIKEEAMTALLETDCTKAVDAIIQLMEGSNNAELSREAFRGLGKISQGNPKIVDALVTEIENPQHEFIRREAVENLCLIGQGNPQAVEVLVKLIDNFQDEVLCKAAVQGLGLVGKGNPQAVAALVKLIENPQHKFIRREAVENLCLIGQGNLQAVEVLVKLIDNFQDEVLCKVAVQGLGLVGKGNPQAVDALVKLIDEYKNKSEKETLCVKAALSLGKIEKSNEQAVNILVELILNTKHELIRWQVTKSLGAIGKGSQKAVDTLVEFTDESHELYTRWEAAYSLGQIDKIKAVSTLLKLIDSCQNRSISREAAEFLGKIDKGNPKAIDTLVKLIEKYQQEPISWMAAESLGIIDTGNQIAVDTLVNLIHNSQYFYTPRQVLDSLKNTLKDDAQMRILVTALKDYLSDESRENDFGQFNDCYEVIWHCAQNLPYPNFYQAWHQTTIQ